MSAVPFKLEVGAVPGLPDGALVAFNGPIDAKNVEVFKSQMDTLRERRFRQFLLQMDAVRYINSTGLAYLINMAEQVQADGGEVVLLNVQPKVKVILDTMGLLKFLRLYPSRSAAVKDLQASAPRKAPAPATPPAQPPGPSTIRRLFRGFFGPPGERNTRS